MAGNNYTIPIGADVRGLLAGIDTIDTKLDQMTTGAAQAGKELQDAMARPAAASDKLTEALARNAKAVASVRDAAKLAGKDISDALSGGTSGKDLEAKIEKFKGMLFDASKGSKLNLGIEFNEATIKELQNGLKGVAGEMEHFRTLLAAAKVQLASLDPGSADFASLSQQIGTVEGFLDGLVQSEGQTETASKSLKAQLRAMKEELALMEEAGKLGTQEFEDLAVAAGQLEDQIGDTAQRIRVLASDTKYIDATIQGVTGLVGALTAGTGAIALFGNENKDLQEAMVKVQGAMALLMGVQQVANTLNKDSAFSVLFLSKAREADAVAAGIETAANVGEAAATEGAAVATRGFTAALLANPITAVVVGILAAVAALAAFTSKNDAADEAVKRLNKDLQDEQDILAADLAAVKARTDVYAATADLKKNNEQEVIKIQGRGLQDQMKLNDQAREMDLQRLQNLQDATDRREKITDDEQKQIDDLNKKIQVGQATHNELVNQIDLKGIELQKQRIEDRRKIRDEILSMTKELQAAQNSGTADQTIQQKAALAIREAREETTNKIAELKKEILLSTVAEGLRNDAIVALRKALGKKITDIERDKNKELAALDLSAAKSILEMEREGQEDLQKLRQLDLRAIDLEYAEKLRMILENFKGQRALQDQQITALEAYIAEKKKEVRLKYAQQEIDQETQIQVAAVNLLYGYAPAASRVEKAKQEDILRAQIQGAENRLQALRDAGKKETDLAVILAKDEVAKLKGELTKSVSQGKKFDNIFDLLGFEGAGGLTPEQVAAIGDGTQKIVAAFKQITDAMLAANQQQITSSTEKVNAIDAEINKLQEQYDSEVANRKKGLANNAEYYKQQLDQQKKAKEDEIKNREELFQKQKQLQKEQLLVDTVSQASSLITASANVIEGFSTIPIVGPALGIIAVGAMIAGFIAAKIQAFNAINSEKPTFREGGWIDGPSHEGGGVTFMAQDGSGVELEGGEHVTRRGQAAKFAGLLEAINTDAISSMSDEALADLLRGTGVSFATDVPERGVRSDNELQVARSAAIAVSGGRDSSKDMKAIREDVHELAQAKRAEVATWEDADFYYEKKGNRTIKIRKK